MHKLGLAGNYALPPRIKASLKERGLHIEHMGQGAYTLKAGGGADLDQLCPEFIARNGDVFDLENITALGRFLHQPIEQSLRAGIEDIEQPSHFRERAKLRKVQDAYTHDARSAIHRMLRFAITSSVEIPPDKDSNLEKDTAECHAATEQAIRDRDAWNSEVEFGNPKEKISALPYTAFDPQKGFMIPCADLSALTGENQKALQGHFSSLISKATKGRYSDLSGTQDIWLSAKELESLCALIDPIDLKKRLDAVEFEEAVQQKLSAVQERALAISSSPLLAQQQDKSEEIVALMRASSALTPVLSSGFMRDAWSKYNFTHRHESPLEGLSKEMAVFMEVCNQSLQGGQTSAEQMEAIATEFYSLIAFSGHMTDALDQGLEKLENASSNEATLQHQRNIAANLKSTFHDASVAGVDLDVAFLSDEQRDALKTLKKHAGKPNTFGDKLKSGIGAPFAAGGKSMLEFTGDVVNFVREDTRVMTGFVILAGTLIYMNGGDPSAANAAADMSTGLAIGADGSLTTVVANDSNVPKDLFGNQPFHWDLKFSPVKGYYAYKHFAESNFIVGPAQQIMEAIRSGVHGTYGLVGIPQDLESSCDAASTAVIGPVAGGLFGVNLFQNFSHAAFWMWSYSRGYEHGHKGFSKIFELAAPINDLAYQIGSDAVDTVRGKKRASLSENLFALRSRGDQNITALRRHQFTSKPAGEKSPPPPLAKPAIASLPEFELDMRIDGMGKSNQFDALKRRFSLNSRNIDTAFESLEKLDHIMKHAQAPGLEAEGSFTKNISVRIDALKVALQNYQQSPDRAQLDQALDAHLEHITAAELRYRGQASGVYEAFFESAPDAKAFKRLKRSGKTAIGQHKRQSAKDDIRKEVRGENGESLTLSGHAGAQIKLAAIHGWAGTLEAAKTFRRVSDKTINSKTVTAGLIVAGTSVGMDYAGVNNAVTDTIASVSCGGTASGVTVGTFLNFNFWEDAVGVHLGTGLALMFSGAVSGYTVKRGLVPAFSYAGENRVGAAIGQASNALYSGVRAVHKSVAHTIAEQDRKLGQAITDKISLDA